ncbi:unnamed protein product [Lampetra fluviatilis]
MEAFALAIRGGADCRHVVAVRKARPGGSIAAPGLATGPARRVAGGRDVALSLRRKAAVPDRAVPGLAVPCLAGPVQLCPAVSSGERPGFDSHSGPSPVTDVGTGSGFPSAW